MEVRELPLLPHTEKWNVVNKELEEREVDFFAQNPDFLRDKATVELENSGMWQDAIKNIREEMYGGSKRKNKSIETLIREHLGEGRKIDYRYFKYLVQKSQIEKMKEMWNEEENQNWSDIEPYIPEKDYIFIFHSYLRYLQVNDNDAKNAGVQAEGVAKMAQYILDSEIIADEKIQNDFYHMISEELALTDEEFEELF